ncbi:hypothetical protein Nepgr_030776 [Nepenthes gracilis]|uniref:Uncharacterized protein n=1 Tax=Nepenthes gracilis TaxID=150966 RepID=A0AAD3Y4K0_NEPGR|nr:hypothetical protein Nepgr_030776 [Nepenthes gracilis]
MDKGEEASDTPAALVWKNHRRLWLWLWFRYCNRRWWRKWLFQSRNRRVVVKWLTCGRWRWKRLLEKWREFLLWKRQVLKPRVFWGEGYRINFEESTPLPLSCGGRGVLDAPSSWAMHSSFSFPSRKSS